MRQLTRIFACLFVFVLGLLASGCENIADMPTDENGAHIVVEGRYINTTSDGGNSSNYFIYYYNNKGGKFSHKTIAYSSQLSVVGEWPKINDEFRLLAERNAADTDWDYTIKHVDQVVENESACPDPPPCVCPQETNTQPVELDRSSQD
tara:strand:+ start:478 stop:924 length:447 start_codon:yes stop_codon:yes gene_type:complete